MEKPESDKTQTGNYLKLSAISVSHLATDGYQTSILPVLPLILKEFSLSAVDAGIIRSAYSIASAIFQIPLSFLSDYTGKKKMVFSFGLLGAGCAFLLFGITKSFYFMLFLIFIAGIGSAAHHPQAVSIVAEEFPRSKAFSISFHSIGGNIGSSIVPVIVGIAAAPLGWRSALSLIGFLGLALSIILFLLFPDRERERHTMRKYLVSFQKGIFTNKPLFLLALTSSFRAMSFIGITTFIPLYVAQSLNFDTRTIGYMVAMLYGAGILSEPLSGMLADKYGSSLVLTVILYTCGIITLSLAFVSSKIIAFVIIFLLGFFIFGTRPVIHAQTVQLAYKGVESTSVGIVLTINGTVSSLSAVFGGWLADIFGLRYIFFFYTFTLLCGGTVALIIEKNKIFSTINRNVV